MRSDPADPYRDALYAAEDAALPSGGRRFTRFAALRGFVEEVVAGEWWESTFPDAPVEVTVLRRSRGATFSAAHVTDDGQEAALFIRDGSWTMSVVAHELAHVAAAPLICVGNAKSEGPHGETFAGALLLIWRRYLGVHAYGALLSALNEREVPYRRDLRG